MPIGRSPGGGGDGSGAFGAVLKQGNDGSKGLFVYGDETDPSWHLRGVERERGEAAVQATMDFPGAGGSQNLRLIFGDTARDDRRYRSHLAYGYDLPETVNRYVIGYAQHPDPSARTAMAAITGQLTVRAALAGVPGNALRVRLNEGRMNVPAAKARYLYQGMLVEAAQAGTAGNALRLRVHQGTPAVGVMTASLRLSVGGGSLVLTAKEPGAAGNDIDFIVRQSGTTVPGRAASGTVNSAQPGAGFTRETVITKDQPTSGTQSDVTVTIRYAGLPGLSLGHASASQDENGNLVILMNGNVPIDRFLAAVNGVDGWSVANPNNIQNVSAGIWAAGQEKTFDLGDAWPDTVEADNSLYYYASRNEIVYVLDAGSNQLASLTANINRSGNRVQANDIRIVEPGTTVPVIASFTGLAPFIRATNERGTHSLTGGADATTDRTPLSVAEAVEGQASVRYLVITGVVHNVDTIQDIIDAYSGSNYEISSDDASVYLFTAAGTARLEVSLAGGINAAARTALAIAENLQGSTRTLQISGVVPGVDTIANLIAAYTDSTKHYELVGTGTDFVLTAAESEGLAHQHFSGALAGGRAALNREDVTVRVISRDTATGAVTYRITLYGSDSPLAQRSTLGDIRRAWQDAPIADEPAFTITGNGTDKIDVDSLPTSPSGGSNFVPAGPIEFLVRDADQADGKNIEVRYHQDEDTQQEIVDASLVKATNPGGAKVIVIFGTDLTEEPEEPPVTRPMYPEAGLAGGTPFTPSKTNIFEAVKAIFHPSTNPGVTADDQNRELDVASGGTAGTKATTTDVDAVDSTDTAISTSLGSQTGLDDAKFLTVSKAARLLGRVVKTASTTLRGVVLLARNADVDASETDTTRVPDVARAKRLIQRLAPPYVLPAASESAIGGVRNVSTGEAGDPAGTVFRAWSSAMITKVVAVWRVVMPTAEAEAGSSNVARFITAQALRAAINAVVPAVFRTGNTARIDPAKMGTGARDGTKFLRDDGAWIHALGGLMREVFNGQTGAVTTEQRAGDDYQVPDSNNVVLLVQIGTMRAFYAGDDFSALREADNATLDGVTIYSNAQGHFLLKQPTAASRIIRIWIVEDVEAFADIAARFLPTVDGPTALDGTNEQRRIWNSLRVWQAARAATADSVTGGALANGVLSLTRRSGANPVEISGFAGGNGGVRLVRIGARFTAPANTAVETYLATGITPTGVMDDDLLYLRIASPDDGDPPVYWAMRGETYNALSVKSAGDAWADGDTYWDRIIGNSDNAIHVVKSSTGELLVGTDGAEDGWWVEGYNLEVGGGDENTGPLALTEIGRAEFALSSTNWTAAVAGESIVLPDDAADEIWALAPDDDNHSEALVFFQAGQLGAPIDATDNPAGVAGRGVGGGNGQSPAKRRLSVNRDSGNQPRGVFLTKAADGTLLVAATNATLDFDPLILYRVGRVGSALTPSISHFTVTGDLTPEAGDIGGDYRYSLAVAQAAHAASARIVYFAGTERAPNAVTVLKAVADLHDESGTFSIPGGTMLAAGAKGTIRLEVYEEGQAPATHSPIAYQDVVLTAHAPATARYHWGRVQLGGAGETAAQTAGRIVFATDDTTTGNSLLSQYTAEIPDDGNSYQNYLAVQDGQPEPAGFTQAGLDASGSWNAAVDHTYGGTDYKVYILKRLFAATHTEDDGRVWGITRS